MTEIKYEDLLPLSIVIPAFNEEGAIEHTLTELNNTLLNSAIDYEIIVVNDCSTDKTGFILEQISIPNLRIINHKTNKGYGASLKAGIFLSEKKFVAITDADGTYPNSRIPELAKMLEGNDMLVGARTGKNVKVPLIRKPAKFFIGQLASYLTQYKIPDINSGLRIFKKETLLKYINILPDGFSFTTTITLAMLTCKENVLYVPIDYAHRVGKSKIRPIHDTLNFIQLIIRTILLFEPLRIFLPLSFILLFAGLGVGVFSYLYTPKFMDMTTSVLIVGSLQMLGVGMLADMINRRLNR